MAYITHAQRTLLAYQVYREVVDTAGWLRGWMRGPFESVDLTPQGFRLLVLLFEEGRPMRAVEVAKRLRFRRQNLDPVVGRLEDRGWVKRIVVKGAPAEEEVPRRRTRRIGRKRRTWGFGMVELTPQGQNFLKGAFPSHAKVLKGLMRALHVREQKTLIEICQKLRKATLLKFISDITRVDEWERPAAEERASAGETNESWEEEKQESEEEPPARPPKSPAQSAMERFSEKNVEVLESIVAKMKRDNILVEATHVDWNLPRDEEREAGHVIRMLRNCGTDRERRVLERLCRGRTNLDVVAILKEVAGVDGSRN